MEGSLSTPASKGPRRATREAGKGLERDQGPRDLRLALGGQRLGQQAESWPGGAWGPPGAWVQAKAWDGGREGWGPAPVWLRRVPA